MASVKKDAGCANTGIAGCGTHDCPTGNFQCRTICDDRQLPTNDGFGHLSCALVTLRTVLKSPLAGCGKSPPVVFLRRSEAQCTKTYASPFARCGLAWDKARLGVPGLGG
ncbi:MAG: hypothetical protein ABI604_13965 [Nitrospirota bacterium]